MAGQYQDNRREHLSLEEAAELIGVTTRTLARYHRLGIGPARIKLPQKVIIRRGDLDAWLDAHVEPAGPRVGRAVAGAEGLRRAC